MDKLKEIRENTKGEIEDFDTDINCYTIAQVQTIQSETYQLGREEVIKGIEKLFKEYDCSCINNKIDFVNALIKRWQPLKESK